MGGMGMGMEGRKEGKGGEGGVCEDHKGGEERKAEQGEHCEGKSEVTFDFCDRRLRGNAKVWHRMTGVWKIL